MKIAVLADIHGNYRALEAVTDHLKSWQPNQVFVAGDIVNRGPRSLCCQEFIRAKEQTDGWQVIRGNHEDYVIARDDPNDPKSGHLYELFKPVHFTYDQLNQDVTYIRSLPESLSLDFGQGGEVRMLHASMVSNREGVYPETQDSYLAELIAPAPALFITGHTHRALVRSLNGSVIVNAGSVGLPFDGDPRAGYVQIIWDGERWQAEIIRLDYDRQAAEMDFFDFDFLGGGGPIAELVLLELKLALSQLYHWTFDYSGPILNGDITVDQAVQDFTKDPITKPYW